MLDSLLSSGKAIVVTQVALGLFGAWQVAKAFYNLYFHPLRKFPGPKIAVVFPFHEFYYDVIRDGIFLWEIEKMHDKYGPIVRINANELHIRDPHFVNTVYAGPGRRTDKYLPAVDAYDLPTSSVATVKHDAHRTRRGILNPYFSKRAIVGQEPFINERISYLCSRLTDAIQSQEVIALDAAFSAMTCDIVNSYFYGVHFDYLSSPNFRFVVRDAMIGNINYYHFMRFFPVVVRALKSLPLWMLWLIQPDAAGLMYVRALFKKNIEETMRGDASEKPAPRSVILAALKDPSIPAEEKTIERLVDEGQTVIFAGTETTSRALALTMFYILDNRAILDKLRAELQALGPISDEEYSLTQLETLPYLTAVINEGFRFSYGLGIRMPRVAPDEALEYQGYTIPPGTAVSINTILTNHDPSIFPNPWKFDPDRWIKAQNEGVNLKQFVLSFSKGTRQCLGINLAHAEMYLALARIIRNFDLQLYDTTALDVEPYHIRATAYPRNRVGEVKVKVVGKVSGK